MVLITLGAVWAELYHRRSAAPAGTDRRLTTQLAPDPHLSSQSGEVVSCTFHEQVRVTSGGTHGAVAAGGAPASAARWAAAAAAGAGAARVEVARAGET